MRSYRIKSPIYIILFYFTLLRVTIVVLLKFSSAYMEKKCETNGTLQQLYMRRSKILQFTSRQFST